jgi:hypothetical protein
MPTTSSRRFPRILAHVDGSRQAWVIERNTSHSVLAVGNKGVPDKRASRELAGLVLRSFSGLMLFNEASAVTP